MLNWICLLIHNNSCNFCSSSDQHRWCIWRNVLWYLPTTASLNFSKTCSDCTSPMCFYLGCVAFSRAYSYFSGITVKTLFKETASATLNVLSLPFLFPKHNVVLGLKSYFKLMHKVVGSIGKTLRGKCNLISPSFVWDSEIKITLRKLIFDKRKYISNFHPHKQHPKFTCGLVVDSIPKQFKVMT